MLPPVRSKTQPSFLSRALPWVGGAGLLAGGAFAANKGLLGKSLQNLTSVNPADKFNQIDKSAPGNLKSTIRQGFGKAYDTSRNIAADSTDLAQASAHIPKSVNEQAFDYSVGETGNAASGLAMTGFGLQAGGGLLNKLTSKFPSLYSKAPTLINSIGTAARDNTGKIIATATGAPKLTRFGTAMSKTMVPLGGAVSALADIKDSTSPQMISQYMPEVDGNVEQAKSLARQHQLLPRLATTGLGLTSAPAMMLGMLGKHYVDGRVNNAAMDVASSQVNQQANGTLMDQVLKLYQMSGNEDQAQSMRGRFLLRRLLESGIFKDNSVMEQNPALGALVDRAKGKYGI